MTERDDGGEDEVTSLSDSEIAPVGMPVSRDDAFDPAPELAELRESRPVCPMRYPDGHPGWLTSSHDLARAVLKDPRFSMRPLRFPIGDGERNMELQAAMSDMPEPAKGSLLSLDPPEHVRLRRLLAGYFTVERVSTHRPMIEQIVSERLDAIEDAGPPVDLVEEFALPIPSIAICQIMGVPAGGREEFERPSRLAQDMAIDVDQQVAALRDLLAYTRGVVEQKNVQPGDDLLSELVQTGELTDEELTGSAAELFEAAHETTATMIAFGTYALLHDRSRWEYLRAKPDAIENVVEELLRYLTIFHLGAFARTATEDLELDGECIRAGESVAVSLSAANRDPKRFPDPDDLDLHRDARGHVAFGHGRHMCLGQHLARLELQVALGALVRRFPTLHLAVPPEEVPMSSDLILYGVDRLPVAW